MKTYVPAVACAARSARFTPLGAILKKEVPHHEERYIAAICAGPMALGKAGVITNKKVTSYPGEEIESYLKAGKYVEEEVVVDGHIITSSGPATAFAFAYKLLDVLGIDSSSLKHGMLYDLYR